MYSDFTPIKIVIENLLQSKMRVRLDENNAPNKSDSLLQHMLSRYKMPFFLYLIIVQITASMYAEYHKMLRFSRVSSAWLLVLA